SSLSGAKERDHPVLMRNQRIRANQNPFDPTEDRGVGSDPEHKAKNRENGKTRATHEHARAEANVLQKFICPGPYSLLARDSFGDAGPMFPFSRELFASRRGQFVIACFAIVIGHAPFRRDPSLSFQAVKGGI